MNTEKAGTEQSVPASFFVPTSESSVFIEEQREGYTRYIDITSGRRWEVYGICVKLGHCLVGAVVDGKEIATLEKARELATLYTGPDNPVLPGFEGCCPFTFKELNAE